jgi:hypothetical protein
MGRFFGNIHVRASRQAVAQRVSGVLPQSSSGRPDRMIILAGAPGAPWISVYDDGIEPQNQVEYEALATA